MKKYSFLSISLLALLSSNVYAGKVIYEQGDQILSLGGRMEARGASQGAAVEDRSRMRINIKGISKISETNYIVGYYELQVESNDFDGGDSIDTRYVYTGIGGIWGELTYGKNEGALMSIKNFTDIMSYHGSKAAQRLAVANRTDNLFSYEGAFEDISFVGSYRFADRDLNEDGDIIDNNENGYSLSSIYSLGDSGVRFGAGYAQQNDYDEYMLSSSYKTNGFYLGALFTDGNLADELGDYRGYEIAGAYKVGKFKITSSYNLARINEQDSIDNIAIDFQYFIKSHLRASISYNFNLINEGDTIGRLGEASSQATEAESENEIAFALRYKF